MSLLRELVKEMAVTAAHAVGGAGGHQTTADLKPRKRGTNLFKGGMVRRSPSSLSRAARLEAKSVKAPKNINKWNWRIIGEMMDDTQFDASDVMSKLDAAEKRAKDEQDTTPFGLEDDDGNIIKVYVKSEEADEFESALGAMLAGEDEDEDDKNTGMEIAEVLFQLKDKFQIVDVQWPSIEGDEEEEQEVTGGAEGEIGAPGGEGEVGMGEPGAEGEMGAEGGMEGGEGGLDAELGLGDEEGGEGEGLEGEGDMEADTGPEGMLQQVIDTMKADAEARKADAEARTAEAQAREAEANSNQSANKVKQEEQVMDMEQWEKDQKSQEDETSKLARMAKMKHQQAQDVEVQASQEEEERLAGREESAPLSQSQMLQKILDALQRNS